MKSILIVGAFGFLGSHITLSSISTNYKIILFVKKSSDSYRIPDSFLIKTTVYYADEIEVEDLYNENDIFLTIISSVQYDSEFKYNIYNTNLLLPLKLIEHGQLKGCKNYIVFGSFYQKYPDYHEKKDYTLSKTFFTKAIIHNRNVRIFNLQLEHMYGPKDNQNKFIPWILDQMKKDEIKIDLTDCIQKRDFIYVSDVVSLISSIIEKCEEFSIGYHHFEVGTGKSIEIRYFLELLKSNLDSTSFLNFGALPMSKSEIKDSSADIEPIIKKLSWQPKYTLAKGIQKIIY